MKDLEHWAERAERVVVEELKIHRQGYDPSLASLETEIKVLVAVAMQAAYEEGRKESGVNLEPQPVNMSMTFREAEAMMTVLGVLSLWDFSGAPQFVADAYTNFKEATNERANDVRGVEGAGQASGGTQHQEG